MGLPLLLPLLLLLPASLQDGGSAKCKSNNIYEVIQPEHLSAPEGGSILIPFSFCYSWKPAKDPQESIFWRWENFHGKFIHNTTPPFTHKDFKNRLVLNWTKGARNGSLLISNLRKEDNSTYFCRVQLTTQKEGQQMWQSILGTSLTITRATEKTTTRPTSTITTATTTDGVSVTKNVKQLTLEATIGVALAVAVLIIAILGLMVYLRWKGSKGLQTKARAPARGSFHGTEESKNIGNKGQRRDPKLDPKVDGIVYASLALPSSTSPSAPLCHPVHKTPQEETLYSTPKVLRSGTER
ncbi:paired immunoglobulin-like type 2 receptor alpha [Saccopteryx bilineata]|uniref:paired immunoglobulin-like type 2 receptor alpha n=1 Tax=Saccopteryx bilineata TaxID=59482 RepID=UPI00338FE555